MSTTILLKRGLRSSIPAHAPFGEPFLCADTGELFIGMGDTLPLKKFSDNATTLNGKADSFFQKAIVVDVTAPQSPEVNDLFLDISSNPIAFKIYTGPTNGYQLIGQVEVTAAEVVFVPDDFFAPSTTNVQSAIIELKDKTVAALALKADITAMEAADDVLHQEVVDEAAARDLADQAIIQSITDLKAGSTETLAGLAQDIADEAAARLLADQGLAQDIADEETRATGIEAGLQTSINNLSSTKADVTAMEAADAALAQDIADEEAARILADQGLAQDIADEEAARILADQGITQSITDLKAGSTETIASLNQKILDEATRADGIEDLLAQDIADLDAAKASKVEVQAAVDNLQDQIDSATTELSDNYLRKDGTNSPTADINMANHKITNLAQPSAGADAATKGYVDALVQGIDWKDSVLDKVDAVEDITTPVEGGRYLVGETIQVFNGTGYDLIPLSEGSAIWVENEDTLFVFNGTNFVKFGSTLNHNMQMGLQGGQAEEYFHLTLAELTRFQTETYTKTEVNNLVSDEEDRASLAEDALAQAITDEANRADATFQKKVIVANGLPAASTLSVGDVVVDTSKNPAVINVVKEDLGVKSFIEVGDGLIHTKADQTALEQEITDREQAITDLDTALSGDIADLDAKVDALKITDLTDVDTSIPDALLKTNASGGVEPFLTDVTPSTSDPVVGAGTIYCDPAANVLHDAVNAFNHETLDFFGLDSVGKVGYEFNDGLARKIYKLAITAPNNAQFLGPKAFTLKGSDSQTGTFTTIATVEATSNLSFAAGERKVFNLTAPATFTCFEIEVTELNGTTVGIVSIELLGNALDYLLGEKPDKTYMEQVASLLQGQIDTLAETKADITAMTAADAVLHQEIVAEATQRGIDIGALNTALTAEIGRATDAEEDLQTQITGLGSTKADLSYVNQQDTILQGNITDLAGDVESYNNARISDINGLDVRVTALETTIDGGTF